MQNLYLSGCWGCWPSCDLTDAIQWWDSRKECIKSQAIPSHQLSWLEGFTGLTPIFGYLRLHCIDDEHGKCETVDQTNLPSCMKAHNTKVWSVKSQEVTAKMLSSFPQVTQNPWQFVAQTRKKNEEHQPCGYHWLSATYHCDVLRSDPQERNNQLWEFWPCHTKHLLDPSCVYSLRVQDKVILEDDPPNGIQQCVCPNYDTGHPFSQKNPYGQSRPGTLSWKTLPKLISTNLIARQTFKD